MSRAQLDKDPVDVATMFDAVAPQYDWLNTVLSGGQDRAWRKQTLKALRPQAGQKILDLAAGTGSSSEVLADVGVDVIASDFSLGMLKVGKKRRPDLEYIAADATNLPFADDIFDAVTISYGLRNVVDTSLALEEMYRVTKPGGKIVVAEFSTPTNALFREVYRRYLVKALPLIAEVVSKEGAAYDYLAESIQSWPDQKELGNMLAQAGWNQVEYKNLTGGIVALHRAQKPDVNFSLSSSVTVPNKEGGQR